MTVQHRLKRDHSRAFRLLMGFVIAVLLVVAPQVAQATFTSSKSANLSVGTLKLVAPATVSGSSKCPWLGDRTGYVEVTEFGAVPNADSYLVTLKSASGEIETATVTKRSASLRIGQQPQRGTWTLTISAKLRTWSGPDLKRTFACEVWYLQSSSGQPL